MHGKSLSTYLSALVAMLLPFALQAAPFAYIARSNGVSVIDVQTQVIVAEIPTSTWITNVRAVPGSTRVLAAGGQISVIDTAAQAEIARSPVGPVEHIAVSPTAPIAYATLENSFGAPIIDVRVVSTGNGTLLNSFTLPGGAVGDVAFNAAGDLVLIANFWGHIHVLNAATGAEIGRIPSTNFPDAIAVHPTLDRAYVARGDVVSVYDLRARTLIADIPLAGYPRHAVVNAAGTRLYLSNYLGASVSVIDTATHQVVGTIAVCTYPWGIDVTPDGQYVYVICPGVGVDIVSTSAMARVNSIAIANARGEGRFIGGRADAPAAIVPVPTLSEWAMILLALLILATASGRAVRRPF